MKTDEVKEKQKSFIQFMKLDKEASANTIKAYARITRAFCSYLPSGQEFSKNHTMKYKADLQKKFAPSTVQNYIVVMNKFIKFCVNPDDDEDMIKEAKKLCVKNIKVQQRSSLDDVLEPAEFKRLLRIAKKTGNDKYYLIMKVFAYTGIRIAELEVFTVENVKKNQLIIHNKGKYREIVLRLDLRRELLAYCNENNIETGLIFRGRNPEKLLSQKAIWDALHKIAGKARGIDLKKIHAHSFRHLFAVEWMKTHNDVAELADILGHSSIETTRIYVRTTNLQKRKKLEEIKY